MEKSHCPESEQVAQNSGNRRKLVFALTLAVFAAGLFAHVPFKFLPNAVVGIFSGSDCNRNNYSSTDVVAACTSVAANSNNQIISESSIVDAFAPVSTDSAQGGTSENLQGRPVVQTRVRHENPTNIRNPRPGRTMAELCTENLEHKGHYCEAGRYDGTFKTDELADDSDPVVGLSISGRVLTADGHRVDGVKIVASPERLKSEHGTQGSGTLRFWTMSDALGAYTLDGLPDGEYTIRSSARGPYKSARISVRAGVNYADLVVSRNAATVVEGRVVGDDGAPLEGVIVLPLLLGQPSTLTGNDGQFRLRVTLKPTVDSFSLRFQRPGYQERSGSVRLDHPGASDAATVDVVMHTVESWAALGGTIYSDSGDPLERRTVELRPRGTQQKYTATTDRDGKYAFPMVESPADYRLIVYGGADHGDYEQVVRTTVDMDELDIVVKSYEFGTVSGRIVNPNGEPVPNFDLLLRNLNSRKPNAVVSTDEYGNFEIPAAPAGELVLASQSTPSILIQGLRLSPGDKLHLPLVLDWGQHEIRGLVVDRHGNPVAASRIVLRWTRDEGGITTRATRRTAADTQGHFTFGNLGPGPHSLQIDAPGFSPVDIDHDLSRQGYDVTVKLN